MQRTRWVNRSRAVIVMLLLLAGCASTPPVPVTSIDQLVGKWSGTVDLGGPLEFFYLTINPDGTLVSWWGINWTYGRITIANSQVTYEMYPPPLEGTIRLYDTAGKPSLDMVDTFASFRANVTKEP